MIHTQVIHSSINTIINAPCKVRNYLISTYNPKSLIELIVKVLAGAPPPPLGSKLKCHLHSALFGRRIILLVQNLCQVR
jgi:hypothetical protein